MGQNLTFTAPVYFEDTITVAKVILSTTCTNQNGKVV